MHRMHERVQPTINIQEKHLTYEKQIALLSAALHSDTLYGEALRVLVRRLKYRDAPYSSRDLEILLALTLAELSQ